MGKLAQFHFLSLIKMFPIMFNKTTSVYSHGIKNKPNMKYVDTEIHL